jgi:hypothetical protein
MPSNLSMKYQSPNTDDDSSTYIAEDPVAKQLELGGKDLLGRVSKLMSPLDSPIVARNVFIPVTLSS